MKLADARIFMGLPSYDGRRVNSSAIVDANKHVRQAMEVKCSLLGLGFNLLLCAARKSDCTHFLMLHDDVMPTTHNWIDQLWSAFASVDAELMSAVIPIKNDLGDTSIAVESDDPWAPHRMTIAQVREVCPKPGVFECPGLLLNTGMMLMDLRRPWVDKCLFTIQDRITEIDGELTAQAFPEDWGFTRQARAAGCKRIFATTAVPLVHVGQRNYELGGT